MIDYQHQLFRDLGETRMRALESEGHLWTRSYGMGEVLYFENDTCQTYDLVLMGTLEAQSIQASGSVLTVSLFSPGDTLGANLLFGSHHRYPMTITAREPARVMHLSKEAIFPLCRESEHFLRTFIRSLSENATILGRKLTTVGTRSLRENILHDLERLYLEQQTPVVHLPHSRQVWADHLGVQRPSLSRELGRMRDDGLIDFHRDQVTLLYKKT